MIAAEEWSPVDGLDLEPNALAAARQTEGNALITAGPGAGKTELLAQRADFLFRTGASPYPRRILAISFKVDAARNLRNRVRLRSGPQFAARFDSFTFHAFAKRLIDNYRPALTGENMLLPGYVVHESDRIPHKQITFSDFVPLAIEILNSNKYARGAIRQTYSHVFLDEFQDATAAQYSLIDEAFGYGDAQPTAVGDVKQRIMGWAGALDGVMEKFESDFEASRWQLFQNFRSAPALRRVQNRMVRDMEPTAAMPEESIVGDGGSCRTMEFETGTREAAAVARLVKEWLGSGVPPSEIAILIRVQPHLVGAELMEQLLALEIPFRNDQAAQDLATEPVAALMFDYLRVVADDGHPEAYSELVRLLASEDDDELEASQESRLRALLEEHRRRVRSSEFDWGSVEGWRLLLLEFVEFVTTPVLASLSAAYQQGNRLREVLNNTFKSFKLEMEQCKDPVIALDRLSDKFAVRILTIHKAKGLEFEKVIILGVESQLFFGKDQDVLSDFFVAISRAKNELVVTHSKFRSKPAGANGRWGQNRTPHPLLWPYLTE